ncbi:MAG: OB-fold nucleic acid binding domain-containing protein [Candidatus Woesearchaeota archaeon]
MQRQVAFKLRVADILNNPFIRNEGWQPNSIEVAGIEVSRVNLVATVLTRPEKELNQLVFLLDDGTGQIPARFFGDSPSISSLEIGDIVLVIARPREYNNQRYLVPEIVRKISDPKWIELRNYEIKLPEQKPSDNMPAMILAAMRRLDKGDGVDYQALVSELGCSEETIDSLLKQGELFQIRPGRLKLLG